MHSITLVAISTLPLPLLLYYAIDYYNFGVRRKRESSVPDPLGPLLQAALITDSEPEPNPGEDQPPFTQPVSTPPPHEGGQV